MTASLEDPAVARGLEKSILIPIPKKGSTKERSKHQTTAPISHSRKAMLKILHARIQHSVNQEFPDIQAGFRKGRGTRGKMSNIPWITEKARNFRKVCTSVSLTKPKPLDHHKLYKALRNGNTRPLTRLLRNLYACRSRRNSQNPDGTTGWFRVEKGV